MLDQACSTFHEQTAQAGPRAVRTRLPAVAGAAGWENWFAAGSVLQIGDATVISAYGDGDFAGVHSRPTPVLQARNVRLSVMSPDWSSVRQLQVLLSTEGNFESVTFTDLRELLLVAPEGEWIELTVPTGAWQSAVRAEEAWSTPCK